MTQGCTIQQWESIQKTMVDMKLVRAHPSGMLEWIGPAADRDRQSDRRFEDAAGVND